MTINTTAQKNNWAENAPYFKTSQSSVETWTERAQKEIEGIGGKIISEINGSDLSGRAAFLIAFTIGEDKFKLVWPVLESKTGNKKAAKIQAATALYHDVKARVVAAKFLGIRESFFGYLLLPNGQTVSEATSSTLLDNIPTLMIRSGNGY